jgi:hypothetical protein
MTSFVDLLGNKQGNFMLYMTLNSTGICVLAESVYRMHSSNKERMLRKISIRRRTKTNDNVTMSGTGVTRKNMTFINL